MPEANGVMIVAEVSAAGGSAAQGSADRGLAPITAELAGIGRKLADELQQPLSGVLLGAEVGRLADDLAALGVDQILVTDDAALAEYQIEPYLAALTSVVREAPPEVLLLGQTLNMRELAARLAFRLETGLTTDCTGLRLEDGALVMTKPVYGGSALAEFTVETRPQMATIRPRAFEAATPQPGRQAEVRQVSVDLAGVALTRVVETVREAASAGPSLKDAKTVVSGGRGLGGPDNWHFIEELADSLGAAVGATRAVTDAGWVPPAHQVGLTGVTITPDLYVTVGVSGAVQHIAGCSGSRNIVAINKDPDANIFKHARFGIVGDYKPVVPALTERIKALRG